MLPTPLSPAALGKRFTSQLCSRRRLQPLLLTRLNRSLHRCRRLSRCCRLLGREGGAEQRRERVVRLVVRRLNLVRRPRLASQLNRELRVRLRVLVVTATRVVVHDPRPACAADADRVEGAVALPRDRHGRAERGEVVQLVHAVTVLVVGVVDGFLQRDPRLVLLGAVVQAPASVWRESAVNAREGIPRFDQATDVRAIPHAYFTYEQSGQRSQKSFEKLQKLRKLRPFSVLKKRPLWWASLYSRALTTICVDEVPTPRSRPTTVRQGNGGL